MFRWPACSSRSSPAGWTWWTVGSRPGVPFVFSHRIFTQTVPVDPKVVAAPALVSSGVPVQHRTPRPISLPENSFVQEALAPIRPWGSAAEKPATLPDPKNPQPFHREVEGHISIGQPCDNACFALSDSPKPRALTLTLLSPPQGRVRLGVGEVFDLDAPGANLNCQRFRSATT
jgi:hypothetical protein